jgi:hypothetical protein
MPSKRPQNRKRRKKQKRVWSPPADYTLWLWALLALNVVVGLAFSPVTGSRLVRVVGARAEDEPRIAKFLRAFEETPYSRVNEAQVATLALEDRSVERASFRTNVFGRGVLDLSYRRPVARVEGTEALYLSSRGALFTGTPDAAVKVLLSAPGAVPQPNLSVFSSWRSGVAAQMCDNIAERLPDRTWRMVVSASGFVSLESEGEGTVEFGSFEDADEKVQALVEVLQEDPERLSNVRKLVLTSPSNPVIVP